MEEEAKYLRKENVDRRCRKAQGGQAGHVGHTQVVIHRPNHGEACQYELDGGEGQIKARLYIPELPAASGGFISPLRNG